MQRVSLVLTLFPRTVIVEGSGCVWCRMQRSKIGVGLVSENCFGCVLWLLCVMQDPGVKIDIDLVLQEPFCCGFWLRAWCGMQGSRIGVDLVSQNCFDFSFNWMRACVLYLLLFNWGWFGRCRRCNCEVVWVEVVLWSREWSGLRWNSDWNLFEKVIK